MRAFIHRKLDILRTPLSGLTAGQSCFVKVLLLNLEHLVSVEYPDNLALAADPLIIALNHNCSFETILVPAFLIYMRQGRPFSTVSDWMFGRLPVTGWIFRQLDPVYVYNKPAALSFLNKQRLRTPAGSIIAECINRLSRGQSMMIFPEGTRNKNPFSLLKGRPGIGHIALGSQRPVLPIGIDFPARRKTGRIPHLGSLIIRIGKPMTFEQEVKELHRLQLDAKPGRSALKKVNCLASQITYDVMLEIAGLSGKTYPYPRPCLNQ